MAFYGKFTSRSEKRAFALNKSYYVDDKRCYAYEHHEVTEDRRKPLSESVSVPRGGNDKSHPRGRCSKKHMLGS